MKPTTSYKAFDDSLFYDAGDCADYETHCKTIASIIDQIPRFPIDKDFVDGMTYYQHDSRIILPARDDFFMYLDGMYNNPTLKYPDIRLGIGEKVLIRDRFWWYKLFTDHGDKAALLAWQYIGCTDDYFRQWGQLYFAIEPPEDARAINP